jgi:hypothetical protein
MGFGKKIGLTLTIAAVLYGLGWLLRQQGWPTLPILVAIIVSGIAIYFALKRLKIL